MKTNIKHFSVFAAMLFVAASVSAQKITVSEPDSVGAYCIMTSDSTYDILPREEGKVKPHRNKVSKISRLVQKASSVASAGAVVGGLAGNSLSSVTNARKVMDAAGTVSSTGNVVNAVAGIEGQDIAFKGKHSPYKVKNKKGDMRILINIGGSEGDPATMFRVVKFFEMDGDRRVQWGEYKPALVGEKEARAHGYVGFSVEKYGEKSLLLTIPENQLKSGEYGIVIVDVVSALAIPVGTFSI